MASLKTVVLMAALAALFLPLNAAPAGAATPCSLVLINDWFDGRIDDTYPTHCYREAIKRLPEDVQTYSSAKDEITRALLASLRHRGERPPSQPGGASPAGGGGKGGAAGPVATSPTKSTGPKGSKGAKTPTGTSTTGAPRNQERTAAPAGSEKASKGPVTRLVDALGPKNADSIPLPLLILAGVALLLLAAAGASFLSRRLQARRVPVSPPPHPPRRPS